MKWTEAILPIIITILVGLFITILTEMSRHINAVEDRQMDNSLYIYKLEQNHERITELEKYRMSCNIDEYSDDK